MGNGIAVCRYCQQETPSEFLRAHILLQHADSNPLNHWPQASLDNIRGRIRDGDSLLSVSTDYGVTQEAVEKALTRRFGRFWRDESVRREHVAHRRNIVRRCGARWSRVIRLRRKGESWAAIDRQVSPPA